MTPAQITAVLMVLQAFGVGPNVIAQVKYELTPHTTSAQSVVTATPTPAAATTTPVGSGDVATGPTVGAAPVASSTPATPAPTCSFSVARNKQGFPAFSWNFTPDATGHILGAQNLVFYGNVSATSQRALPFAIGTTDDGFIDRSYNIKTPVTYTLTATDAGGTATCQATLL